MRVLLIQPRPHDGMEFKRVSVIEPLALETIAACLEDRHEVRILDLVGDDAPLSTIASVLESYRPDACGITCTFTVDVYETLRIARLAKQAARKPFVLVGGHHATLDPEDFADPAIDAICIGEGEVTARETLECLETGGDLRNVRGLALNTREGQVFAERRPFISDLDSIPLPARHLTQRYREQYYFSFDKPVATLQTARGCPYRCSFCSVWRFYQGATRTKSPERVVEELAQVQAKDVLISDDNFTLNVARASRIGELLRESGIRKRYTCQARSDTIVEHPELVDLWKQAGLVAVFIGFEKVDAEEMQAINKRNRPENNDRALEILHSKGVGVIGSFIVDPQYGHEEFERLRQYIKRHRMEGPSFSILTPLPGTQLYAEMKERLVTTNYELFDLLHAVLPTKLKLSEFYHEYASLYKVAYSPAHVMYYGLIPLVRGLASGKIKLDHFRRIFKVTRSITDPAAYLAAHGGMEAWRA